MHQTEVIRRRFKMKPDDLFFWFDSCASTLFRQYRTFHLIPIDIEMMHRVMYTNQGGAHQIHNIVDPSGLFAYTIEVFPESNEVELYVYCEW